MSKDTQLTNLRFNRDSILGHPDQKHLYNSIHSSFAPSTMAALQAMNKETGTKRTILQQLSSSVQILTTEITDKITTVKTEFTDLKNNVYGQLDNVQDDANLLLKSVLNYRDGFDEKKEKYSEKSEQDKLKDLNPIILQTAILNQNNSGSQGKQDQKPEARDQTQIIWKIQEHNIRMDVDASKLKSLSIPQSVDGYKIFNSNSLDAKPAQGQALGRVVEELSKNSAEKSNLSETLTRANTLSSKLSAGDLLGSSNPPIASNNIQITNIKFSGLSDINIVTTDKLSVLSSDQGIIVIPHDVKPVYKILSPNQQMPVFHSNILKPVAENTVAPFSQVNKTIYPNQVPITVRTSTSLTDNASSEIKITQSTASNVQNLLVSQNSSKASARNSGEQGAQQQNSQQKQQTLIASSPQNNPQNNNVRSNGIRTNENVTYSLDLKAVTAEARQVNSQPNSARASGPNPSQNSIPVPAKVTPQPSIGYNQDLATNRSTLNSSVNVIRASAAFTPSVERSAQITNISGSISTTMNIEKPKPNFVAIDIANLTAQSSFGTKLVQPSQQATRLNVELANLPKVDEASKSLISALTLRNNNAIGERGLSASLGVQNKLNDGVPLNAQMRTNTQVQLDGRVISLKSSIGPDASVHLDSLNFNAAPTLRVSGRVNAQNEQLTQVIVSTNANSNVKNSIQTMAANHLEIHPERISVKPSFSLQPQNANSLSSAQIKLTATVQIDRPSGSVQMDAPRISSVVDTAQLNSLRLSGKVQGQQNNVILSTPHISAADNKASVLNVNLASPILKPTNSAIPNSQNQIHIGTHSEPMVKQSLPANLLKSTAIVAEFSQHTPVQLSSGSSQNLHVLMNPNLGLNSGLLTAITAKMAAEDTKINSKSNQKKSKNSSKIGAIDEMDGAEEAHFFSAPEEAANNETPDEDAHAFTHHTLSIVAGVNVVSANDGTAQAGLIQQMGYTGGSAVTTSDEMWNNLSVHLRAQVHASRELRRPTTGDIKILMGDVSHQTPAFRLAGIPQDSPALMQPLPFMMSPEFNVKRAAHALA